VQNKRTRYVHTHYLFSAYYVRKTFKIKLRETEITN
jgi:hypothetical protein